MPPTVDTRPTRLQEWDPSPPPPPIPLLDRRRHRLLPSAAASSELPGARQPRRRAQPLDVSPGLRRLRPTPRPGGTPSPAFTAHTQSRRHRGAVLAAQPDAGSRRLRRARRPPSSPLDQSRRRENLTGRGSRMNGAPSARAVARPAELGSMSSAAPHTTVAGTLILGRSVGARPTMPWAAVVRSASAVPSTRNGRCHCAIDGRPA